MKQYSLFYSNGLAIWLGFPDFIYIKVNDDRKSPISNFIQLKFFRAYSSLKPHILVYSNGVNQYM